MSGGAFDYNCFRISQFAEELKNRIDENHHEINGRAYHYNLETITLLNHCQKAIELAGELAHEVEWLYSGDIGEETFKKRFNEIVKV
jgi:hypothetical protein